MDYSISLKQDIGCIECHKVFKGEVWIIVDIVARPDLVEKVKSNSLHMVRCPHCLSLFTVNHPLMLFR